LEIAMTMPVRAALYLRVSTGWQADNDLSIPDQRRQAKAYCASRGWEIVADYVEPGASATDDRRPEFQRMIDAATTNPPAFDVILVHSFSRFFRDQFQLEFYVRRLAKATVTTCGRIRFNRQKINLSQVFAGQTVGIKQTDERIWPVSFMDYDLGYFDDETCRLEPLANPFGPKVLPMPSV
jgi:hypothetical protein